MRSVNLRKEMDAALKEKKRVQAAITIQSAQRGKVSRKLAAQRRGVERPRAIGLNELCSFSNELMQHAELMPTDGWGFVQLGSTISRSELDELQLEAASEHCFQAHELGLPVTDSTTGQSGIRPVLVFDTNASAEQPDQAERVFPLNLGSAAGRRRALLRQEMRGLTVDRVSRTVLSRPLHKLWPLGERSDLRIVEEQWLLPVKMDREVSILEYPSEASQVHFWELNGRLHAVTRTGPSATPRPSTCSCWRAPWRMACAAATHPLPGTRSRLR